MTKRDLPFSERYNLRPKKVMQAEQLSADLRNGLYNAVFIHYLSPYRNGDYCVTPLILLVTSFWVRVLKQPLDEMPTYWEQVCEVIKNQMIKGSYFDVYDLIEFFAKNFSISTANKKFMVSCNEVLLEEMTPYRFVGGLITKLTTGEEIEQVESALQSPLETVTTHIKRAHELLADKKNKDYRNSIKESISAVEAMCQEIDGERATLGSTLGRLSKKGIDLPASLQGAFEKLYGWSSSEDGIRHALLEKSKVDHEDAMFALVTCSAFINCLTIKADKACISFKK